MAAAADLPSQRLRYICLIGIAALTPLIGLFVVAV